MSVRKIVLAAAFVALMLLYNLPFWWTSPTALDFWQRPVLGVLPASIAYYLIWLALTVPFGWWLLRATWRDAR